MAAATALSPRISFSHDIDLSPPSAAPRLDTALTEDSDTDFDFSVSLDNISVHEPSPADHLFSHGILLPLSSINPAPPPYAESIKNPDKLKGISQPNPSPPTTKPSSSSSSSSSSFWNMGRSSSVGTGMPKLRSVCPFPRSKSTGSYLTPSQSQSQSQNQRQKNRLTKNQNVNAKNCYYYSGSGKGSSNGNGVRINPVINVPAHFIPRGGSSGSSSTSSTGGGGGGGSGVNSFFAYLLCNCRDKNGKGLVCEGEI